MSSRYRAYGLPARNYRRACAAGPSYLKVDSLYTKDLDVNEGNRSVVTSLAGVAKSLGIECIAEGVSTNEDVAALFKLGIRGASGKAIT